VITPDRRLTQQVHKPPPFHISRRCSCRVDVDVEQDPESIFDKPPEYLFSTAFLAAI